MAKINIALTVLTFLFPFLIVWIFWFATGMAFNTQLVFNSGVYWFFVGVYEVIAFPLITAGIWDKP